MDARSPNANRLRDTLNDQYPEVEPTETSALAHLDLVSSVCTFTSLDTIVINFRCVLPTFGIEKRDFAACHRAYLTGMAPTSTGSTSQGWRCNYVGAYIGDLNRHVVVNSLELSSICALVRQEHLTVPHPTVSLTLSPERKETLRDPGVSPHLHLDQFSQVIRLLSKIGEGSTRLDADLPDDDELISSIHYGVDQACSSPVALSLYEPLPDLQDFDPNYEIGTQPG
jgi:hypothetical protein